MHSYVGAKSYPLAPDDARVTLATPANAFIRGSKRVNMGALSRLASERALRLKDFDDVPLNDAQERTRVLILNDLAPLRHDHLGRAQA